MTIEKCPICYGRQFSDDNTCLRCQAALQPLVLINQHVRQWSSQAIGLIKANYDHEAQALIQQIKGYKNNDFYSILARFIDWRIQQRQDELRYRK